MKHLLLKTWMLITLLFVGIGTTWAETYTGTVANSSGNVSSSFTLNSVTWNISTTSGSGSPSITYGNAYNKKCIKFGSGASNCFGSVSLSTDYFKNNNKKVTKVVVNALGSAKKNVTFSIGSTSITSEVAANAWTAILLDNLNVTSTLRLDFQLSSAGFNIQEIVVTYENAGGTVEQYSYTLETVGSGTTTFKDGSNNVIAPSQKVNSGTKIYPNFEPADGYEFTSWEYWGTSDGEELWKKVNGEYFTITKDVKFRVTYTATVPKAKYPVTIVTPENGTLTIKDGSTVINNGDDVEEGKTLTIEVKANDGYRFKNWGYKDGDANWVGNMTSTFTHAMPSAPCSFKATFEEIPTYTINWSVNGRVVKKDENEKDGTELIAPDVSEINGKKFMGWVKTPTVDAGSAPTYETIGKATEPVTYYAVFATAEEVGGGVGATVELTNATIKSNASSKGSYNTYSVDGWTGKYLISNSNGNYFVQLGYNAETSKSAHNSHLATPEFTGGITSITINTCNNTAKNRTFYLCSSNDLGTASEGEFGSGAIPAASGSVTITVTGSPKQVYIYPNGTAYIESVSVTYGGTSTSYSDFTTLPAPPTTVSVSSAGWATYASNTDFVVNEENEVYYVSAVGESIATATSLAADTKVKAGEGVLIKGEGVHTFNYTADATEIEDNLLVGVTEETEHVANAYILAMDNGKVCFCPWAEGSLAANKCYLPWSGNAPLYIDFDDETNGIQILPEATMLQNTNLYNMAGQKVNQNYKGIILVNGKKVLNK